LNKSNNYFLKEVAKMDAMLNLDFDDTICQVAMATNNDCDACQCDCGESDCAGGDAACDY
jgi:hypothetical protein